MPFRQIPADSPRGTTPGSPGPVPPPNPPMPPPLKFPFEDRDIPGPPEGMTIPPPLPGPARRRMEEREQQRLDDKTDELRNSQPNPETPYWELDEPEYKKRIAQGGGQPPPTV